MSVRGCYREWCCVRVCGRTAPPPPSAIWWPGREREPGSGGTYRASRVRPIVSRYHLALSLRVLTWVS